MSDHSPFHMWSYWRGKYGYVGAMRDYYPHLVTKNPVISAALAQIEMGQRTIDSYMQEQAEMEDPDA